MAQHKGFCGVMKLFPNATNYVANSASANAANPLLLCGRFFPAGDTENIAVMAVPASTTWDADIAIVQNFRPTYFREVFTRAVFKPKISTFDLFSPTCLTACTAALLGLGKLSRAAGARGIQIDPENYDTSNDRFMMFNFDQAAAGTNGNGVIMSHTHTPSYAGQTRAQFKARMRVFGSTMFNALFDDWSTCEVNLFFMWTFASIWTGTGGLALKSSISDSDYASNGIYNLYPDFLLGLYDALATHPQAKVVDMMEQLFNGNAGYRTIQRFVRASRQGAYLFSGNDSTFAGIANRQHLVRLPLYPAAYLSAHGAQYAGYNFITDATRVPQTIQLLFEYLLANSDREPWIWDEAADPWGQYGAAVPIASTTATPANAALACYLTDTPRTFDALALGVANAQDYATGGRSADYGAEAG